jgi:hypothetical protein
MRPSPLGSDELAFRTMEDSAVICVLTRSLVRGVFSEPSDQADRGASERPPTG